MTRDRSVLTAAPSRRPGAFKAPPDPITLLRFPVDLSHFFSGGNEYKLRLLGPTFSFLRSMVTTTTSTTSASQSKLSAAGHAFVTGIAILANPRKLRSSKTFVLDAQFYLESVDPIDQKPLLGSLRYFNSTNLSFDDEPNLYVIYAKVSTQIIICLHTNRWIVSLLDKNLRPIC
jgi:hypothetical protein